ncbi:MAG: hypothetical protein QNJ91_16185 [Gammaproteobacteria bacterium]|nr:hypothetical protein [Gammaproteobacteria bacterium]
MDQDTNRLLMELERSMREANREAINPNITALTIDGLRPVLCLVANARARYLKALFDLGADNNEADSRPNEAQLEQLRQLRGEYDELMKGARELEIAIQRGYLDVLQNGA